MNYKLEICVDSVESAINAQKGGATRILTSGQKDTVPQGAELIRTLVKQAGAFNSL